MRGDLLTRHNLVASWCNFYHTWLPGFNSGHLRFARHQDDQALKMCAQGRSGPHSQWLVLWRCWPPTYLRSIPRHLPQHVCRSWIPPGDRWRWFSLMSSMFQVGLRIVLNSVLKCHVLSQFWTSLPWVTVSTLDPFALTVRAWHQAIHQDARERIKNTDLL